MRKLGIRKVPWVIHRFKELYKDYLEKSVSFDLRTILIFESRDCPDHVTGDNIRACFEDSNFRVDLQWMSDLGKCSSVVPKLRKSSNMDTPLSTFVEHKT